MQKGSFVKTLNATHMMVDLSPAIPLLNAIETAENFPALFEWCQRHDDDRMLDEAMVEIQEYCPWLWPSIDRAILQLLN